MSLEHPTPANDKRIPSLVQWKPLADLADALALSVNQDGEQGDHALRQRIYEFAAPYLLLAELDRHAEAVLRGDGRARAMLLERLTDLQRLLPSACETGQRLLNQSNATDCKDCAGHPSPTEDRLPESVTLDPDALLRLALAAHKLESSSPGALETVVGVAAYATTTERLANALASGGHARFVEEWNWLVDTAPESFTGHFARMSGPNLPMLLPMSGGGPSLGPGFDPGHIPGSGGAKPPWEPPPIPGRRGSDILNEIFKERDWVWDHKPIYKAPILDSRYLQCLLAYGAFWDKNPPPEPPAREVWADNITSLEAANPCAGGTLIIHGHGFGSPKPANVDLVLAVNGVCRPFPVDPSKWSDTRIEVVLPVGVTSSPVGFCDRTYVDAYDAWVQYINAMLPIVAVVAGCARIGAPDAEEPWHTCPPRTSVNYAQVGSAQINSLTVNGNKVEVAEPATFLVLGWDVSNAIDIKIEQLSATGPLATPLINLPQTGLRSIGYAGHTGPDRFYYRLTAQGPCNSVTADVSVVCSAKPYLSVQGMEVTQGIQNTSNSVRLVAEKPTMVRVTVRHGLNGWGAKLVPNVYGRIMVKDASALWATASVLDMANNSPATPPLPNPGASITVVESPQRRNTNDTLNFILPTFLCKGDIDIRVQARVDAFDERFGEFTGWQETVTADGPRMHFEPRKALDVRFVQVNWTTDGSTSTVANCETILRNSLPMLPTPQIVIAQHVVGVVVSTAPNGPTPAQLFNPHKQDVLNQLGGLHECIEVEINESEIGSSGVYCFPDSEYLFVGVMAGNKGGLANRPGPRAVINDTIAVDAAHELAHCHDQKHLFSACATLLQAVQAPFDPASTLSNNGQIADVPFDTVNNRTVTSANPLFDIMTYCAKADLWTHPDRWERLFNQIGA